MEGIIAKITDIYQKEKENIPKNNSPQKKDIKNLTDQIYVINQKQIGEEQSSSNKKSKEFFSSSFEGLKEKEMISFIENNNIPIKYLQKVLKEIFKCLNSSTTKNKSKDIKLLSKFLEKNKNKLTEKHILYIFKKIKEYNKINTDEIIKYIVQNIKIDDKYFLEILKEEEMTLNKNIIDGVNSSISVISDEDKRNFLELVKSLNLISYVKQIITEEEYNNYEEKINKIFEEFLNKQEKYTKICDKEFNEEFNTEFINSMKIINSNPNKAYFIQEKITI